MLATLPPLKLLLHPTGFVIDIIVTVVVPLLVNVGVLNVPLPGVPAVKLIEAVRPLPVLAPVRLYVTV